MCRGLGSGGGGGSPFMAIKGLEFTSLRGFGFGCCIGFGALGSVEVIVNALGFWGFGV